MKQYNLVGMLITAILSFAGDCLMIFQAGPAAQILRSMHLLSGAKRIISSGFCCPVPASPPAGGAGVAF